MFILGDLGVDGVPPRDRDERWIDLDADAARAVLLCRDDGNAAIARSQVVNDVGGADTGQLQHGIRNRMTRGGEVHIGRSHRPLRECHGADGGENRQEPHGTKLAICPAFVESRRVRTWSNNSTARSKSDRWMMPVCP